MFRKQLRVKVSKITSWDLVITNKELELTSKWWAIDSRRHHALEMLGHLKDTVVHRP